MEESTLMWPTDKEREEMEEVCSIGEVPHTIVLHVANLLWLLLISAVYYSYSIRLPS